MLTHDASMDFAASQGQIDDPEPDLERHRRPAAPREREVLGALWLDSESLAQFQPKDLELITAVANQAAMFIENTSSRRRSSRRSSTRERFSRLLSPNVAEQVISGKLEVKKGGQLVAGVHRLQQRHPRLHRDERGHDRRGASSRC